MKELRPKDKFTHKANFYQSIYISKETWSQFELKISILYFCIFDIYDAVLQYFQWSTKI